MKLPTRMGLRLGGEPRSRLRAALAIVLLLAGCGAADRDRQAEPAADGPKTPYVRLQTRDIKALSADEVEALLAGRGMAVALVAELNQHPGPKHVLENLAELNLTPEQEDTARELERRTIEQARQLGAEIVDKERLLDSLHQVPEPDVQAIRELVVDIGRLRGELRWTHIAAHHEMKRHLGREQITRYDELRGYGSEGGPSHHHAREHHQGGAHSPAAHGKPPEGSQP